MKLTKQKLISTLTAELGLTTQTSKEVIDLVFSEMGKTLNQGGTVILSKIGTLNSVQIDKRKHSGFRKTFECGKKNKIKFVQSRVLDVVKVSKKVKNLTPKKAEEVDEFEGLRNLMKSL